MIMNITLYPGCLNGTVHAIPSKSHVHRLLICAAFADQTTLLTCPDTNRDIEATVACLVALGAKVTRTAVGYQIIPVATVPKTAVLNCGESGSTLRFMLPVAGALGVDATFLMDGRLPQRPLSPLWEEMERMGCQLSRPTENTIRCHGQLKAGQYTIAGDVSSQFITGLLLAFSLMDGCSSLAVTGKLESRPYVDMTVGALKQFGVKSEEFYVTGGMLRSPGPICAEGDWSNGAFFLAAAALGNPVTVTGLTADSTQGDRICASLLQQLRESTTVSCADIPDLVPILSVVAAANQGAQFTDIRRLRLKESNRIDSVIGMLRALGGNADATQNTLTVYPSQFIGGTVDACNDHRIAMSAAIAATICREPVTIIGADCVNKSYPGFWDEYKRLGGCYEQYLR